MNAAPGAARKAEQRQAAGTARGPDRTGPCQYKDKSPRPLGDQRERTPAGGRVSATGFRPGWQSREALAVAVEVSLAPEGRLSGRERAHALGQRIGAARKAVEQGRRAGVVPKHVAHCNGGAGSRAWWLYTWKRSDPSKKTRIPYNCASWRCPHCARYEASVTFARIKEAFAPLSGDGAVFIVLTLDREGYYSRDRGRWPNVTAAFRDLGKLSEKFLKRLRRMHKRMGWAPFQSKWVATVEAHRSNWPHLNIVVHSPELAEYLENDRLSRERRGFSKREQILVRDELRACVVGAGWGPQSTAERGRDKDALAGYITKLAGLAASTAGEVAKLTQAPTAAPERFRRLRSGKGFLPPRRSDPEITGTLVRRYHLEHGPTALPIHNVPSEAMRQEVAACCVNEENIWVTELEQHAEARLMMTCGLAKAKEYYPPVSVFRIRAGPAQAPPAS